jgi:hypothetical protein
MSEQNKYEEYLQGFTIYLNKLANKVAVFTYLDNNQSATREEGEDA